MNQPPQFVPHLPSLLAAVLFAARHKVLEPVPGEPGVMREVDRIRIDTNAEKGVAMLLIDPQLYNFFIGVKSLNFQYGSALVNDVPPPHNQRLFFAFGLGGKSEIVLANGQQADVEPDPADLAALKMVLG